MSDPLYKKELLRLAADAHGAGKPSGHGVLGSAHNPACGDRVTIELQLKDGRVTAVSHELHACVLAQASASILGAALAGSSRADLQALRERVSAMLKTNAPAPDAPFTDYTVFDGVADFPKRHTCVLLPIDAALAAFDGKKD
jgi:SUF system NifU family Fe-S assembly protein